MKMKFRFGDLLKFTESHQELLTEIHKAGKLSTSFNNDDLFVYLEPSLLKDHPVARVLQIRKLTMLVLGEKILETIQGI